MFALKYFVINWLSKCFFVHHPWNGVSRNYGFTRSKPFKFPAQERWRLKSPHVPRPLQKPPHVDNMWPGQITCRCLQITYLNWMEWLLTLNWRTDSDQTLNQTPTTPSTVTITDEDPIQRTNPGPCEKD